MTIAAATSGATTAPTQPHSLRRTVRQLGVDTAYLLLGMPLAVVSFTLLVTGLSLGAGLLITVIGIPVLAGTLYAARGFAEIERLRLLPVLRMRRTRPSYKRAAADAGFWRRAVTPLTDGQTWLDLLHGVLILVPATATWSIAVTWWSGALAGTFSWAYDWALPRGEGDQSLPELLGLGDGTTARILFQTAVGLVFLVTLPFVLRGAALVQAWFSRALLTGVAELRQEISGLTEQAHTERARTAAATSAEAIALRRLERDIHDGPQQRLVRIAVDLGRAQQQLAADPEAARRTVDEALAHTREALGELRTLSRGIAPPILTDRGLSAALAALAARCTVPVSLDLPELESMNRADPLIEQAAYFAAAEALTNVAKHSRASQCVIALRVADGQLTLVVTDDGAGGAHLAKGHGLAGLADRLAAAGGRLTVTSLPGGPTIVTAELPWP